MPSKLISIKLFIFLLLSVLVIPVPGLAHRYSLEFGEEVCKEGTKPSVFYCNCPQTVTPDNFTKIRSFITDGELVILEGDKKYFPWHDNFLCPLTEKINDGLYDEMVRTGEAKTKTTIETFYYHTDHLGGTSVVTDEQGEVVETLDYYPYGDTRISEQTRDYGTQKKFTGQEEDPESDLYYFNSRYYDPNTGRFTGQDPVFQALGDETKIKEMTGLSQQELLADPQKLNSYSYGRNNPIIYTDKTGEMPAIVAPLLMAAPVVINYVANYAYMLPALFEYPRETARVAPYAGDVIDAVETVGGRDAFSGEPLSNFERLLTAGAAVVPFLSGKQVRGLIGEESTGLLAKLRRFNITRQLGKVSGKKVNNIEIPSHWEVRPAKSGGGYRYIDPDNPAHNIRLSPGNPSSSYYRGPYMRIHTPGGYTDINGNVVADEAAKGHIPIISITD